MNHPIYTANLQPSHFGIQQSVLDQIKAKLNWNWPDVLNFILTKGIPALGELLALLGIYTPPLPVPPAPPVPAPTPTPAP